MATHETAPAQKRDEAAFRDDFDCYFDLHTEDKIRLAVDILGDVCDTWDHEHLEHYPENLPSFDEFVADLSHTLLSITWNHGDAE